MQILDWILRRKNDQTRMSKEEALVLAGQSEGERLSLGKELGFIQARLDRQEQITGRLVEKNDDILLQLSQLLQLLQLSQNKQQLKQLSQDMQQLQQLLQELQDVKETLPKEKRQRFPPATEDAILRQLRQLYQECQNPILVADLATSLKMDQTTLVHRIKIMEEKGVLLKPARGFVIPVSIKSGAEKCETSGENNQNAFNVQNNEDKHETNFSET